MTQLKIKIDRVEIGKKRLCYHLDFQCESSQFWCLLGPNGSGKTTLLHTLAGLMSTNSDNIILNETALLDMTPMARAQQIGILLQDQPVPFACTVAEGLRMARYPYYSKWQYQLNSVCEDQIKTIMQELELMPLGDRLISELSGGEQQRFHIAMLRVQDPQVYILDEPTNHLDLRHQIQILRSLKTLADDKGKIIIAALHDINLAYQFADYVCFLYENGETEIGKTEDLFEEERVSRLYQQPIEAIHAKNGQCIWVAK